jgi:prevent-host-death family protein
VKTLALSEAKDQLSALVEEVEHTHQIVTISKHGRPAAVFMAVEDFESLQETLFWLSKPGIREDLVQAEATVEASVSTDQLRHQLGLPPQ